MSSGCVFEPRGGAASASSGSDVLDHDDHGCSPATGTSKRHQPNSKDVLVIHNALRNRIQELEQAEAGDKESAKQRKKLLREVSKYIGSKEKSVHEKMEFVHKKFMDQVTERGRVEKELGTAQQQLETATAEKETAQHGLKKANLMNDKLQELCRTLQKQSREVLDEAKERAKHEADQRKQLGDRMETTMKDVTSKLEDYMQENNALREKLQKMVDFCEDLEKNYKEQLKKKDIEVKLVQEQLKEQVTLCEQQALRGDLMKEHCKAVEEAKKQLQDQLGGYKGKFEEFQSTINASNKMFNQLKAELKSSRKKQEKICEENSDLKKRCNKSDLTIINLLEERTSLRKQVDQLEEKVGGMTDSELYRREKTQKERMESLCRALQKELQAFRGESNDQPQEEEDAQETENCTEQGGDGPSQSEVMLDESGSGTEAGIECAGDGTARE